MKRCENCRWWTDAKLSAQGQDIEVDSNGYVSGATHKSLGYCKPAPPRVRWKGLVASDYSCGEHAPKEPTP